MTVDIVGRVLQAGDWKKIAVEAWISLPKIIIIKIYVYKDTIDKQYKT